MITLESLNDLLTNLNRNTIKEYKISDILRPKKVFLFNSARRLFKESRVIIKVQFLF